MAYKPIGSYGVIGNMRTAALVAMDGAIDWLCYPHFDSPSVFAAILDDKKGGFFRIAPAEGIDARQKQFYWPDTNVLVTRFLTDDGVAEITDFMPVGGAVPSGCNASPVIRDVHATRGTIKLRMDCRPAFDYARTPHVLSLLDRTARFSTAALSLSLTSSVPMRVEGAGAAAEFTLSEGQRAVFTLSHSQDGAHASPVGVPEGYDHLTKTVDYWHRWLAKCTYKGRWRETVQRSALALKLMTFEPTGAIVAALTTSLPESVGGRRNWDYRYTWIRDAAFTVYGLLRIGLKDEAAAFMGWIEERCHELEPGIPLRIMYGIDGRHNLDEVNLDHLEGYRGAKPVRIGNGAQSQLQLDIYGELMDGVYLFNKHGAPVSYELWTHLRRLTDWVCDNWNKPDASIWEVRGEPRHYVYSKLMCWVAIDRALRLADKRSFPADRLRWATERDRVFEAIMARGWSEKRGAFTQSFDDEALDATSLMMPLVFFLSANDPRMARTIEAVMKPPREGGLLSDSLLYRYDQRTGLSRFGAEGSFNMCTFWLVETLTRAGRLDEARLIFEKMLGYGNHLGLFSEETSVSGEVLGNFPQAFTHLGLISAAFNLDRSLGAGN
jgi:GH15 family glucan-1,4-alpha-glucosidase